MKKEIISWFGQSVVDKVVTVALALVGPLAIWVSTRISSTQLQQTLVYAALASSLALVLFLYLNRRFARLANRLNDSNNLHAVAGYITRHRIKESPRTLLNRQVVFSDLNTEIKAVRDTLQAHRTEIRDLIQEENRGMTLTEIDKLLDVFYGRK